MRNFKVLDFIEYENKFYIPGDILILVSEFAGSSSKTQCTVPNKCFCYPETRDKVLVRGLDLLKLEEIS